MSRYPVILVFLSLVATTLGADVTISTDHPYPIRDEAVEVEVADENGPIEGAIVQVEYRPNSSTARTEALPPTDEGGITEWIPDNAGLARLSVSTPEGPVGTVAIAVRFTRFEPSGWAIMIFAGLFLFGGAGYGVSLLLREQKFPGEEPPST